MNQSQKFAETKKLKQNPTINIRNTRIIGKNSIKYQADAEITLIIEGLQYDNAGNIRIPPEWSFEKIKERIENLLAEHAVRVFLGFEKKPLVKFNLLKMGYHIGNDGHPTI